MRASRALLSFLSSLADASVPILKIENAKAFYRHHPSTPGVQNAALFPGLNFSLTSSLGTSQPKPQYWAIVGPASSGKTTLLHILRGDLLCFPPSARTYPFIAGLDDASQRNLHRAVRYVGFSDRESGWTRAAEGAYLSSRYESQSNSTGSTLSDYLKGNMILNPSQGEVETARRTGDSALFAQVVTKLGLQELLSLPLPSLSNGQTVRAKIARALLFKPLVLLLDEPFLGLDPLTRRTVDPTLFGLSHGPGPSLVLTCEQMSELPLWITDVVLLKGECQVDAQGKRDKIVPASRSATSFDFAKGTTVEERLEDWVHHQAPSHHCDKSAASRYEHLTPLGSKAENEAASQPLFELEGVKLKYGEKEILGNWAQDVDGVKREGLWWKVKPGERYAILGPNGSGKTSLLALISGDHPLAYSLPVKVFGRSRLPTPSQPGLPIFDLQARIGQSSPEIHRCLPRHFTVRQVIEGAWAEAILSKPLLTHECDRIVDATLRWFKRELDPSSGGVELVDNMVEKASRRKKPHHISALQRERLANWLEIELDWADEARFHELSLSSQRVALFLRAIIAKRDLILLDEVFSGMDEIARRKCFLYLSYGETAWFTNKGPRNPQLRETILASHGAILARGIEPHQALLCVSHRREEIPPIVNRWVCLPPASSTPDLGSSIRFGTVPTRSASPRGSRDWWDVVWGDSTQTLTT